MPTTLRCSAVLFDNDGVLVDSDASVVRAWSAWARAHGLDPDEVVPMVHGRKSRETVAILIPGDRQAAALADIDQREVDDARHVTPLPGALDLLASMPVGAWAIVTSATRPLGTARLTAAGLPTPAALVTADDVSAGKPHPEGYLAAAALLGVEPQHAAVVEDSGAGIRAARAAGVRWVVGVGERALDHHADVVVRDLRDVQWTGGALRITRVLSRGGVTPA
jgi:sugar-phosphatase